MNRDTKLLAFGVVSLLATGLMIVDIFDRGEPGKRRKSRASAVAKVLVQKPSPVFALHSQDSPSGDTVDGRQGARVEPAYEEDAVAEVAPESDEPKDADSQVTPWTLYTSKQASSWYQGFVALSKAGRRELGAEMRQMAMSLWRADASGGPVDEAKLLGMEGDLLTRLEGIHLETKAHKLVQTLGSRLHEPNYPSVEHKVSRDSDEERVADLPGDVDADEAQGASLPGVSQPALLAPASIGGSPDAIRQLPTVPEAPSQEEDDMDPGVKPPRPPEESAEGSQTGVSSADTLPLDRGATPANEDR